MEMNFDLLKGEEKVVTEKGAIGYKTTGTKLLDASFKVPIFRNNLSVDLWETYIKEAYEEDPVHTLKFILYLRDVRGGIGERSAFRNIIVNMAYDPKHAELAKTIMKEIDIAEYGRWDDVIDIGFRAEKLLPIALEKIREQFNKDSGDMLIDKPISLLAKWLPSERTSSAESRRRAKVIAKFLGMSFKEYRRALVARRKYIDVVEQRMSCNDWSGINYEHVPSKANLVYKNAFLEHDEERRRQYLLNVANGNAKINAGALFPYEIVRDYWNKHEEDATMEELWKNLPAPKKQRNVLVVRDGSGSMTWSGLNNGLTPMDIGDGLTLYMAEHNTGSYKNKFISFGSRSVVVDLSKVDGLYRRLVTLRRRFTDCGTTNLEGVFNLVLDTVIENNVKQEDIPTLLFISDMEFDGALGNVSAVLMKHIAKAWKAEGYDLPKVVFWNVASRSGAIPMKDNGNGLILVSGYSTAIANMVLDDELDPWKALVKVLDVPRYACVDKLLSRF